MNDHAGRFIDHDQVLILKQDFQRAIFGNQFDRAEWWLSPGDRIARRHFFADLERRPPVYIYKSFIDNILPSRSGVLWRKFGQD